MDERAVKAARRRTSLSKSKGVGRLHAVIMDSATWCFAGRRPFVQRYNILLAGGRGGYAPVDARALEDSAAAELARRVLQAARLGGWQIGKTRVFLRAGQLAQLEGARGRRLTLSAITIQAHTCPPCLYIYTYGRQCFVLNTYPCSQTLH